MSDKINRYEKIITVNDLSKTTISKAVDLLVDFIFSNSENNNECIEFFRLRMRDSEKVMNAKDLHMEWCSTPSMSVKDE